MLFNENQPENRRFAPVLVWPCGADSLMVNITGYPQVWRLRRPPAWYPAKGINPLGTIGDIWRKSPPKMINLPPKTSCDCMRSLSNKSIMLVTWIDITITIQYSLFNTYNHTNILIKYSYTFTQNENHVVAIKIRIRRFELFLCSIEWLHHLWQGWPTCAPCSIELCGKCGSRAADWPPRIYGMQNLQQSVRS